MFVVRLRSTMRKSDHFVRIHKGVHLIIRRRKDATQMTREQAEKVAAQRGTGNAAVGEVWAADVIEA